MQGILHAPEGRVLSNLGTTQRWEALEGARLGHWAQLPFYSTREAAASGPAHGPTGPGWPALLKASPASQAARQPRMPLL